jgi:uncharacterized protein YqfB (UPF0267 family)
MEDIPFPSRYKKALLKGTKTSTIHIKNKIGKYRSGKIYQTMSYSGEDWETKIEIIKIITAPLKNLQNYGIPQESLLSVSRNNNLSMDEKVDLIKFKIIN